MLIGSNNSLTYLEPFSWFLKIFKWIGRHQERPYDIQYMFYGARMFDLRLYVDGNGRLIIKDRKYTFPLNSLYEMLDYFNKREDVIVRIVLEDRDIPNISKNIESKFKNLCHILEQIYEHIGFCGGYRMYNGDVIYNFEWEEKNGKPTVICPSDWSAFYRFARKWCPFLMRKFNKMYINRFKDKNAFLMLDYVNRH